VSGSKQAKLKAILISDYWLVVFLTGAFFSYFALDRGGVNVFIEIGGLFMLVQLLLGAYSLRTVPRGHWIVAAVCIYLILISLIVAPQNPHLRWMKNLIRLLIVVFMIHFLSEKKIENWVLILFVVLISATVCWQFAVRSLLDMPHGSFSNKHYLATFAALAFPLVISFFFVAPGWRKFIFLGIGILDANFILQIGSRTAYAGLFLAGLIALIFLIHGRSKWIGLSLSAFFLTTAYMSNYAYFATRIKRLLRNTPPEERLQLWAKAWLQLQENSIVDWIFGHGMGWFPVTFTGRRQSDLIFPHGHFLEILYQSGVVGLVLVYGGLILLIVSSVLTVKRIQNKQARFLLIALNVALLTWMIHCGLAFPIYSKNTLYPLAFILGPLLVVLRKTNINEVK
jgi:O-antigen ligase